VTSPIRVRLSLSERSTSPYVLATWVMIAIALALAPAGCGGEGGGHLNGGAAALGMDDSPGPLLGLVGDTDPRESRIATLEPRTLRPRSRLSARLRGFHWGWDRSPDGRSVALGVSSRGRLQIVDLRSPRTTKLVPVGVAGDVLHSVSWPRPRRILALYGGGPYVKSTLAVVDPVEERVVQRARLRGAVNIALPTKAGLVLLMGPLDSIGPSRMVSMDAEGRTRAVPLDEIASGFEPPPRKLDRNELPVARQSQPAVCVEERAGRAFVVSATSARVAEVDLAGGDVNYHGLREHRSIVARLLDVLEPPAEAKLTEGSFRMAYCLGDGKIAVSGWDERGPERRGWRPDPFGLRLIDTDDWSIRTLDRQANYFFAAGRALLTTPRRNGLIAYTSAGERAFELFRGRAVSNVQAAGRYAYAYFHRTRRTYVVDIRRGEVVRVLSTKYQPVLLVP
jgi:hypothetical protein